MKPSKLSTARLSIPFASAIAALLAAQSIHAGTTWDGGGGGNTNINTATNWDGASGGVVNALNGTTVATFGTAGSTATINVNASFTGITINRDANFTIADGAGALTVGTGGITVTLANTTSRTHAINESSLILNGNQTWTINNNTGTATLNVSSVISETGGIRNLTKAGTGVLNLTGASSYTGATIISGGTLNLGNNTANGSLSSTILTLSGGTFNYTRTGSTTQGFTTTNINAGGASQLSVATGNTLNLGNVVRGTGGAFNFANAGAGTVAALATSNDATGIMAGFTHGNSWAVANGAGVAISALADIGYTLSSLAGDTAGNYAGFNIDVDSTQTPDAAITANSVRFSTAAANTLTLQGTNVITSGGILIGSGVGSNLSAITGGTLAGAASKDLSIIQNNTSGGLTLSSVIANNGGATALIKSGAGLLTLGSANTFTGGVFIHGGTLTMANAGALNGNNVTFGPGSTGTLSMGGNNLTIPILNTDANSPGSAIIENASGANVTLTINSGSNSAFAGVIQNGTGGGTLALTKSGGGTLTLSGANTYTGDTTLNGGTVAISNATSFGASDVLVTGNSRINAAALTYANDISIDASRVLTIGTTGAANSTSTFSGAITGDGGITLAQGALGGTVVNLSSTSNTFTGNITMPAAAGTNDFINFASIGDGGSIIFGRASWLANARYTGAANMEWNTRNIALATTFGITTGLDGGGNPSHMFENNGAGTVTIKTAMGVTSTASSGFFFFGGSNAGSNTVTGAIADPTGANTLGIGKSGTGKWILSNNTNSYEGNVLIFDGTLSVGVIDVAANAQPLGKGSLIQLGYRTANIGTLEYTGSDDAVTDKQIEVGRLANTNNGNFAGGGVILNNGDGTLTFSNTTFNSNVGVSGTGTGIDRTLTLGGTNTGANTIEGTIQDNNAAIGAQVFLTKTGAGTWILEGDNTYTGNTTINGGVLVAGHVNAIAGGLAFGGTGAAITLNTGGILGLGAGDFTRLPSGATLTAGQIQFLDNGGFAAYGADRIVNFGGSSGIVAIGSTATANIGNLNGKTLILGASNSTHKVTVTNTLDFGNASRTIQVNNGTAAIDAEISGVIQPQSGGTAGLTKTGTGTLSLTAANTLNGTININEGTVLVNNTTGSGTGSGAVIVAEGATLGGSGTLAGSTTIAGIHSPGNSPGIQTFGDDLIYSGGASIVNLDLDSYTNANPANPNALFDQLLVAGDLNFAATTTVNLVFNGLDSTVDWTDAVWNDSQSWLIYDVTGDILGFDDNFVLNEIDWLDGDQNPFLAERAGSTFTFSQETDGIYLNYTVVPETSTTLLGALSALALLRRRRK